MGIVARLDAMKDHKTFLRAVALLVPKCPDTRFVIAGAGTRKYTEELRSIARALDVDQWILWLGDYADTPALYNALDVAVLCSRGEGLPNALIEAMACGVATVATDVGDCALITGSYGRIVPPGEPQALAEAVRVTLGETQRFLGEERRQYVCSNFSIDATVQKTETVLTAAAGLVGQ